MYWTYEYVSRKFYPGINNVWTMKGVVEETAALGDEVYLIDAMTGRRYTYAESNGIANKIAHSLMNLGLHKGDRGYLHD